MNNHESYQSIFLVAVLIAIFLATPKNQLPAVENVVTDHQINSSSLSAAAPIDEIQAFISNVPQPPPDINLQSALVKDLSKKFYFLEIDPQKSWPLASLTKLLTAAVALENLENTPRLIQLIKMMMIISDNKAAEILAQDYGAEKFIEKMRDLAKKIGMDQTSIFDTTGLSFLNQSTVKDLEKLVDYIVKYHPEVFQYSRATEIVIGDKTHRNINQFAGQPNFMGGKTGYTDEASGNLVSIFEYQKRPVLIIVMGTKNQDERFNQTKILYQWISSFYK